jgi:hypothetical protein
MADYDSVFHSVRLPKIYFDRLRRPALYSLLIVCIGVRDARSHNLGEKLVRLRETKARRTFKLLIELAK